MVASAPTMRVWEVLPLRPKPRYWMVLEERGREGGGGQKGEIDRGG